MPISKLKHRYEQIKETDVREKNKYETQGDKESQAQVPLQGCCIIIFYTRLGNFEK